MSALTKACKASESLKNVGVDCDIFLTATAMLVAVPPDFEFDDDDIADVVTWFKAAVHGAKGERIYPLFGRNAPIRFINNNKEADVIATLDDGAQQFIRYGFMNRQFATTSGGLCYAAALQSFVQSGYNILEIDKLGRMLGANTISGSEKPYRGITTDFMFSPSPDMADFRNPAKTWFAVSLDPAEYIGNGIIFAGAQSLLSIGGLKDTVIKNAVGTIAHIDISLIAECSEDDLVALLSSVIDDHVTNFVVTDTADDSVVTITGITVVGGKLRLAGTFVTAHTYKVTGAAADVTYANGIEFFDFATSYVNVLIP